MFKYIIDYTSGSLWSVWHEILHHGVSFYPIMTKIYNSDHVRFYVLLEFI